MIDPHSPNPRFYQIYLQLRERIVAGEYLPAQQIPSQQQLMEQYGVSLITVRRALERLSSEGYIVRAQGRGCYVTEPANWPDNRERVVQIGIIVSSIPNSFFPEIIAGVESFLAGKDARLVIAHSRWDPGVEREHIRHFMAQGCAGLLISPSQEAADYRALREAGAAFVFFNHYHQEPMLNYVVTDDVEGARQAGRHLIELGHRAIGAIIGGRGKQTAADREKGFRLALAEAGLELPDEHLIRPDTFTYDEGRAGLKELLRREPGLTAVFCSSEMLALGAAGHLQAEGLAIPGDFSLVAFGDSDTARFYRVPLTTINQPTREMGRRAADMLWQLLNGGVPAENQVKLPCRLVRRQSTGPPRYS